MSSGKIYLRGGDDHDDDEGSLDSPMEQLEPKFADPMSSASSQLQSSSSTTGLNNSNSLLHSTIEEDKEYVVSDDAGTSTSIPHSPKDNWRSGNPFIMVSPPGRGAGTSKQQQQKLPYTSQTKTDQSVDISSIDTEGDNICNDNDILRMSHEHHMDRSSIESPSTSSQGRSFFYGVTKAKVTNVNSPVNNMPWRNVSLPNTGNNSSGRSVGRRPVAAASSASSPMETKHTAKQQAVQKALLKHGHNPLALASTLQSTSARNMGISFVGGVGTTISGASNGEHSESNYSDSDNVCEVNVTTPGNRRFKNILGRSPGNRTKPSFFSSKLQRRTRLTGGIVVGVGHGLHLGNDASRGGKVLPSSVATSRRYKVGDNVLVRKAQSKWSNLVNRYGFPPSEGETPEEQRGPYMYVLAKVKLVHYEEINPYYTVTRCDTGGDQRADAQCMEPLRSHRGEMAALRAATSMTGGRSAPLENSGFLGGGSSYCFGNDPGGTGMGGTGTSNRSLHAPTGGKLSEFLQSCCFYAVLPFLWVFDCLNYVWVAFLSGTVRTCSVFVKRQAELFLYGNDPYVCAMRFTTVNFVVICSTWFLFIDQARLAFFPPSADFPLAVVNLVVWCVLVIELLFQVFVRPEGYRNLIVSDKAFSPSTVRYINAFHLFIESLSLAIFLPEFVCLFTGESCGESLPFSFHNAAKIGTIGPTLLDAIYGHLFVALIRLRVFSMVRHWRNFWLAKTFVNERSHRQSGTFSSFKTGISGNNLDRSADVNVQKIKGGIDENEQKKQDKDADLTNASHIGTALMVTNSYRVLASAWVIMGLLPVVYFLASTARNDVAFTMTEQLEATNLVASDTSSATCNFLFQSTIAWISGVVSATRTEPSDPYLLTVDIRPYRCQFDGSNLTHVRICQLVASQFTEKARKFCAAWSEFSDAADTIEGIADATGVREGSILEVYRSSNGTLTATQQNGTIIDLMTTYTVTTRFDQTFSIAVFALSSLLLQLCLLLIVLGGLSTLRRDAEVFVLGPLRRMLKIVARYARNPLVPPKISRRMTRSRSKRSGRFSQSEDTDTSSDGSASGDEGSSSHRELGSFETEQLITAVAKITDLLRKCWGVAGADIISTNLATREGALTEVFNPTVPGQSVYALFAFAAIGGFDNALRNLGGDVMPLINDVAAVLHDEVFRWGFGDSGQCNKNLGGAFLMVFRIGLVKEVIEKLEQATGVVFGQQKTSKLNPTNKRRRPHRSGSVMSIHSSAGSRNGSSESIGDRSSNGIRSTVLRGRRKTEHSSVNPMSLSLHSLPGISTFTDRAVIGMLKSFAGIHRDRKILNWNDDFRLGAGVETFNISMIFGMDAGWAVEGAVGSEYKIDATYLSPHVNMASRMTSACKQYDVSIMLSQSVQELMSEVAQSKLRHVDTVTVKGSSVKQKVFTYDAKARGVDFFLHSRSEEQADLEADRYSPGMWHNDQDLKAMRQHITDDFLKAFNEGFKAYTKGDWPTAIRKFEKANDIMFQTAVDEGYLEEEFDALNLRVGTDIRNAAEELKRENVDGPSTYLINFMKSHGGEAPAGWEGWHPLTRK